MGDLIALLFLARELAHRAHLKLHGPGGYAAHMALGDFYNEIGEIADEISEVYQGYSEQLLQIPMLDGTLPESFATGDDFIPIIKSQIEWLKANRYTACPREETSIQNIIDEAVALCYRTIYKLKFLK